MSNVDFHHLRIRSIQRYFVAFHVRLTGSDATQYWVYSLSKILYQSIIEACTHCTSSASSGTQHLAFFSTEFSAKYKNIAMIISCVICGFLRKMQGLNLKTVLIFDNYNKALVRYLLKFLTSFLRVQSEPPSLEGLQKATIKPYRLYMIGPTNIFLHSMTLES